MLVDFNLVRSHQRRLLVLTILTRILIVLIVYWCSYLPLFDSSPDLILPRQNASPLKRLTSTLLRWDAFHFTGIADGGYVHEKQWAFFPGTPLVMRAGSYVLNYFKGASSADSQSERWEGFLQGGAAAAFLVDLDIPQTLYRLTLHHFSSPSFAFLVSLLSLLPSSPATLRFAAYGEPFFTFLSYRGMLFCVRKQWFLACLSFALASAFRSNGILLSVYIVWGLLGQPFLLIKRKIAFGSIIYAGILIAFTISPFVAHNVLGYYSFCHSNNISHAAAPEWCSNFIPSIYTHVQAKYWDVGFLKYWSFQQLPNFIIAAPPLSLLFIFCSWHLYHQLPPPLMVIISSRNPGKISPPPHRVWFLSPALTPYTLHALLLSCSLLFAAHVQIALRLTPALPVVYWAAAWLLLEHPPWGRRWVYWTFMWGALSLVLWTAFLPPA